MTHEPTQDELRRLVDREVYYCVSALVHTLAEGGLSAADDHATRSITNLSYQAYDLTLPIPDYEEAAFQAGWTHHVSRMAGTPSYRRAHDDTYHLFDSWRDLCESEDIEPYDREVFEHWIISDWLADKLEAHGEKVDRDFAGLAVWARTTTGQAICMDGVIEDILRELHKEEA
jgi:hypothetical protein